MHTVKTFIKNHLEDIQNNEISFQGKNNNSLTKFLEPLFSNS